MEDRIEQLNELSKFIEDSKKKVQDILNYLGWNLEDTLKPDEQESSKQSSNETKNDPEYPQSFPWPHSVTLDSETITNILKEPKEVPQKFSEAQTNFNREQKLAIYEYVTSKTGKFSEPELSISVSEKDGDTSKDMTFAEIVAVKRNLKRRRLKYRTTKVPPLSHTEEVRNLIDLQMQAFTQYINPDKSEKSTNEASTFSNNPDAKYSKNYSIEGSSKSDSLKDHRKKERSQDNRNTSSKTHRSKYERTPRSPSLDRSTYKRKKRSRSRSRHRSISNSKKSRTKHKSSKHRKQSKHKEHRKKHNKNKHKEFAK